MIRDFLIAVYILALALCLGIWSAIRVTDTLPFYAEMNIGAWTAYPVTGTSDADPYTHAYLARAGTMPLASGEGLAFTATHDDSGERLNAACTYAISGTTPPTRRWTMRTASPGIRAPDGAVPMPTVTHSGGLVRNPSGAFEIRVSRQPQPGNWLHTGPSASFAVILTLYDTAVASSTSLAEITMPAITNLGCGNA